MINYLKLKKYSQIAKNKIKQSLQSAIFYRTGLFLPRPLKIYYTISNQCNFRCQMCSHWKRGLSENPVENISLNKIQEIIAEMAKLGIK